MEDNKFVTVEQLKTFSDDLAKQLTGGLVEKFSELADAAVAKNLEAIGLSAEDFKAGKIPAKFLPNGGGDDANALTPVQKTHLFVKAVFSKDFNYLNEVGSKAMGETTGAAGGFLVPTEVAAAIYRIVEDFGLVRKLATRFPMSTDTLVVPRLGSTVSVGWGTENTNNNNSDWALQNVTLEVRDLIGLGLVSNGLLMDANINVVQQLMTLFAEAIAGEEDSQGLVGTGAPYIGILSDSGVTVVNMASTKTAFTDVTLGNLTDLTVNVKPWSQQGACFIMHRTVWGSILKIQENSQSVVAFQVQPVVQTQPDNFGVRPAGSVLGYPVYLSDKMPTTTAVSTKFIIFGNLKNLFLGDRQQLTMDISPHATVNGVNTFAANSQAIRLVERIAVAVGLPAAFSVLKTAAS